MNWFSNGNTVTTAGEIKIEDKRPDPPEFRREYSKRLDGRALIEIEARTWEFGRRVGGTLIQPNGNRIWFEPERIADKIIDPLLVPLVQQAVDEIMALDRAFIASDPKEFIDSKGRPWRRVT